MDNLIRALLSLWKLGELFGQDRNAHIARLHALHDAQLQHLHDFFYRRAELQRLDMTRVPGAYMCVYDTSKAILSSSINLGVISPLP